MAHVRRLWAVREGSGSASSTGAPAAAGSGAAPSSAGIDENADSDAIDAPSVMYSQAGDSTVSSAAPDDEDGTAVADPDAAVAGHAPRLTRVQRLTDPIYRTALREERLRFWQQ